MNIIRSLIISLTVLVFTSISAFADPALVRISDDDTTIYVLGTFHILPPEAQWRTAAVDAALRESDAIYFEADVWSGGQETMLALVQTYGLNTPEAPLSSMLTAEEWETVSSYAASLGIPAQNLEALQPWFAAVNLGVMAAMAQGLDPNSGVDIQLFTQVSAEGRELRFFETAEQQLAFFAGLPRDVQVTMLVETAAQGPEFAEQITQLMNAWLEGDLERLDEISNEQMREEAPEVFAVLITNRNQRWVADLSVLMDAPGVYFVAVGAAHLPGEDGVAALMGDRGFNVSIE